MSSSFPILSKFLRSYSRILDFSFNNIENLTKLSLLKQLYFVNNKITKIDGLKNLSSLRNLELGANRIRVSFISPTKGYRKFGFFRITWTIMAWEKQNIRNTGTLSHIILRISPLWRIWHCWVYRYKYYITDLEQPHYWNHRFRRACEPTRTLYKPQRAYQNKWFGLQCISWKFN